MTDPSALGLWQTLSCRDAEAMIEWLRSLGFTEHAVFRDPDDPTRVAHAELVRPGGGGVMLGTSHQRPEWPQQPGTAACYLVTDDPVAVHAAAVAAGATSLTEVREQDFGGRTGAVRDPEGNLWSLGDYRPR